MPRNLVTGLTKGLRLSGGKRTLVRSFPEVVLLGALSFTDGGGTDCEAPRRRPLVVNAGMFWLFPDFTGTFGGRSGIRQNSRRLCL